MLLALIGCHGGSGGKTNPPAPTPSATAATDPAPQSEVPTSEPAAPSAVPTGDPTAGPAAPCSTPPATPVAAPTPAAAPVAVPAPPAAPVGAPAPVKPVFAFQPVAPHAQVLPFDPGDEATPNPRNGKFGAAGVFVYAVHGGQRWALLARRASWLKGAGEWSAFGGVVEATDLDSTGKVSFARAAEHELYEETVTVYHGTDANAMRLCPTFMTTFKSGFKVRTFFVKQPHLPASVFNQGVLHAESQHLPKQFRENEKFLWVPLDDLLAAASAGIPSVQVTGRKGTQHALVLHGPFFKALSEPGYLAVVQGLK